MIIALQHSYPPEKSGEIPLDMISDATWETESRRGPSDPKEMQAAANDITSFGHRLSSLLGTNISAANSRLLPEIMGYSREEVDILIQNDLLESNPLQWRGH